MSYRQEGISARKKGVMRCENPYRGTLTFSESWSLTPKFMKAEDWEAGGDACDRELKKGPPNEHA